jgi:hypothetical protein
MFLEKLKILAAPQNVSWEGYKPKTDECGYVCEAHLRQEKEALNAAWREYSTSTLYLIRSLL